MSRKTTRNTILSSTVTLVAVLMMILAAPVQAVQLNLSAPTTADEGDIVGLDLGLDLAEGELVPFDNVSVTLSGPESLTCTFALDGTAIDGCEGMTIFQTTNDAVYGYGYGYGEGYNGAEVEGTTFGYGYGYGYGVSGSEFFWRIEWDTAGITPGEYTVNYFASADGRTFNLESPHVITITGTAPFVPAANLYIQDGFPQDGNYVFVCDNNIGATTFDWDFGDGSSLDDVTNGDIYHSYSGNGVYTVYCAATNGETTVTDTLEVTVTTAPTLNLYVQEGFPQGNDYVFVCEAAHFSPNGYDWDFGDGQFLYDVAESSIYHIYTTGGEHTVSCTASDGSTTLMDWITVTTEAPACTPGTEVCDGVDNDCDSMVDEDNVCSQPPSSQLSIDLRVEDWYPQGNEYSFICDTEGMTPDAFDWEIRHIASGNREYLQYDITNEAIFHRFQQNGDYMVSCTATDNDIHQTLIDWLFVTVSGAPEAPVAVPGTPDSSVTIEVLFDEAMTTLIVPDGASNDIRITVPFDVSDARIDLTQLATMGATTTATLPISATFDVNTSAGRILVTVPAGITIEGAGWDGVLLLPRLESAPGDVAGVTATFELGAGSVPLTFDKGVRILLDGRAGERVGYVKDGVTTEITTICGADDQLTVDAQLDGGECKIESGDDLIIWTEHFTQFVTYTGRSGSSGGSGDTLNENALPPYVRSKYVTAEPEEQDEVRNARDNEAPVIESIEGDGTTELEATEEYEELASGEQYEAPAITGRATGSGGIPDWLIVLGSFTLVTAVIAAVFVRLRRN